MIYRFTDTPEIEALELDVRASGGRLRVRTRGSAPRRCVPAVHAYFAWLNTLRPVRARDDGYIYSLYVPPAPSAAHARQLENLLRNRLFGRRTPMAATLAVTDACQLSCPHCSAALRPRGQDPPDTETWRRVVRECVDLGASVITFTGGEPLLHGDLDKLIAAVPRERAIAEFFSNGLEATDETVLSLRDAGAHGIHLSLDHPDEGLHDRIRGRAGVFRAVARAAHAARRAGLLVGLSTFATNASVDAGALSQVTALGEEWGVSEISVFDGIRTGRLLRDRRPLLDPAHRSVLMAEARRLNRTHRGRVRVVTQSWTNSGRGFSRLIGCLAGNLQCHVTAQGDFTPCDFTPLTFGKVQDASVSELWRRVLDHPAYTGRSLRCRMQSPTFRERHIDGIPENAALPYRILAD